MKYALPMNYMHPLPQPVLLIGINLLTLQNYPIPYLANKQQPINIPIQRCSFGAALRLKLKREPGNHSKNYAPHSHSISIYWKDWWRLYQRTDSYRGLFLPGLAPYTKKKEVAKMFQQHEIKEVVVLRRPVENVATPSLWKRRCRKGTLGTRSIWDLRWSTKIRKIR